MVALTQTPQQIDGKYRVLAHLGQGGTADVSLAVANGPSGFNKLVVLKSMKASMRLEPERRTSMLLPRPDSDTAPCGDRRGQVVAPRLLPPRSDAETMQISAAIGAGKSSPPDCFPRAPTPTMQISAAIGAGKSK